MSHTEKHPTSTYAGSGTGPHKASLEPTPQATRWALAILIVLLIVAVVVAITGILPRLQARAELRKQTDTLSVPDVIVVHPESGKLEQEVVLPGTIQAYADAPLYARTNGYVKAWHHDIGSHVHKGELLAVIATPELDRQVDEARATLATAKANLDLAKVTAQRYDGLRDTNAVSRQSIDTAMQTEAARAASVAVAQQSLNHLLELQSFEHIYAPFDGVITARNVNVGQLVDSGSNGGTGASGSINSDPTQNAGNSPQELFHVSSMDIVRIFIDVPGIYIPEVRPGVEADINLQEYPGRVFKGKIVRTANSIAVTTRTMRVEVDIPNRKHELLPGAYAQIHLHIPMKHPALIIPVEALFFNSEGLRVVTVDDQNRVHLQPITVGRDWGTKIEVLSGLNQSDRIVYGPPDSIMEGESVHVVSGSGQPDQPGSTGSSKDGHPS